MVTGFPTVKHNLFFSLYYAGRPNPGWDHPDFAPSLLLGPSTANSSPTMSAIRAADKMGRYQRAVKRRSLDFSNAASELMAEVITEGKENRHDEHEAPDMAEVLPEDGDKHELEALRLENEHLKEEAV